MIFSLTILNAEKKGKPFFENHKTIIYNNSQIKQSREIGQQINIHYTTPWLEENPGVRREFWKNYLYRIKNYETKWVEMKYCLPSLAYYVTDFILKEIGAESTFSLEKLECRTFK